MQDDAVGECLEIGDEEGVVCHREVLEGRDSVVQEVDVRGAVDGTGEEVDQYGLRNSDAWQFLGQELDFRVWHSLDVHLDVLGKIIGVDWESVAEEGHLADGGFRQAAEGEIGGTVREMAPQVQ